MKTRYILLILLAFVGFTPAGWAQLSLTVGINQPASLVANAGTDVSLCLGDSVQIGGTPNGGTPGYTIAWTPASGLSSGSVQDPFASPAATTTYSQLVTDAVGCTATATVNVMVNALPTAMYSFTTSGLTATFTDLSSPTPTSWTWDYGDGDFGTAQNPTHTYTNPGTYVACVTVVSADGCEGSYCDTVTVLLTGMDDALAAGGLRAFPNPFSGNTQISLDLARSEWVQVSVFDLSGKAIWANTGSNMTAGQHFLELGTNELGTAAGVYLVKVQVGTQVYPLRLVKMD